ncbi:MAG: hypothetical protein IJ756_07750 [Paludibacteraceae bacterium]|nr:hypothetical protein [Paludibacteraceae bacterium]
MAGFESNLLVAKCNKIISDFIIECKKDPYLYETLCFNIYQVEGNHLLALCEPMTELAMIKLDDISIKKTLGTRDNEQIMTLLQQNFTDYVRKTTAEIKGDYRPMLLLLTDCKDNDLLCKSINPLLGEQWQFIYETTAKKTYTTSAIIPIIVAGSYDSDGLEVLTSITLNYNGFRVAPEYVEEKDIELPTILKI